MTPDVAHEELTVRARRPSATSVGAGVEEELVVRLRKGSPGAATIVFERYAPYVRRVLVRVLGPDQDLNDVLHDVFVTVFDRVHTLSDPKAFVAWLAQISVFTARVHIRRKIRARACSRVLGHCLLETAGPADFEARELLHATYGVLERLKDDDRLAFSLRFIHGLELVDVASACNVSLATVKRRLNRAQTAFSSRASREPQLARRASESNSQPKPGKPAARGE